MKRIYIVPAALLAVSTALSGCSSSGSSNKKTTPAGGGTTAAPTTSASSSATPSAAPLPTSTATYPAGTGSITIGSAGFAENEILADIYAGALEAKGVKVTKKLSIGERAQYIAALKDGSIDFVPEYSGSILSFLDTKATAKSPADVYTGAGGRGAGYPGGPQPVGRAGQRHDHGHQGHRRQEQPQDHRRPGQRGEREVHARCARSSSRRGPTGCRR